MVQDIASTLFSRQNNLKNCLTVKAEKEVNIIKWFDLLYNNIIIRNETNERESKKSNFNIEDIKF